MPDRPNVTVEPLTPERWADLEEVLGRSGAVDGCWCMWFRQTSDEYRSGRGDANRQALRAIVERGDLPGIIAYIDGTPAAWCAVQPREAYPRIARSRVTRPVDESPAWAVVCFFTKRDFRGLGLQPLLLEAAVEHARRNGATLIEGYAFDPGTQRTDPGNGFHGFASTFAACGFEEVARRSKARPIMRRFLQ